MPSKWRKREKEVLESLGFKPTPGSGNTFLAREDGETPNLLCQVKSTDGESIAVKRTDLKNLAYHAYRAQRRKPVFVADFGEGDIWVMARPEDLIKVARELHEFRTRREQWEKNEVTDSGEF